MAEAKVAHLELAAVMGGTSAAELHTAVGNLRGRPLRIDASRVVRPATLDIQVLLSAEATWKVDRLPFHIDAPSEAFCQALSTMGLAAIDTDRESAGA